MKLIVSFLVKALSAAAERLLYYAKGVADTKIKQLEKNNEVSNDRNNLDSKISSIDNAVIDLELAKWMRSDDPSRK